MSQDLSHILVNRTDCISNVVISDYTSMDPSQRKTEIGSFTKDVIILRFHHNQRRQISTMMMEYIDLERCTTIGIDKHSVIKLCNELWPISYDILRVLDGCIFQVVFESIKTLQTNKNAYQSLEQCIEYCNTEPVYWGLSKRKKVKRK